MFWFSAVFSAMAVGARWHRPDALLWISVINLVFFAGLGTHLGLRSSGGTAAPQKGLNVS